MAGSLPPAVEEKVEDLAPMSDPPIITDTRVASIAKPSQLDTHVIEISPINIILHRRTENVFRTT